MQKKKQGTAIFMALLMVVIAASISVILLRSQQIDIRRTQQLLDAERSALYAQGVLAWAKSQILLARSNPNTNEKWPLILPLTRIADGTGKITGVMYDATGLFNVNSFMATSNTLFGGGFNASKVAALADTNAESNTASITNPNLVLPQLAAALNMPLDRDSRLKLISAMTAFTSLPLNTSSMTDNYDHQYMTLNPSYRAPHAPMASPSELRLVAGISPQLYNQLAPYLIALPTKTTLNLARAPLFIQKALNYTPTQNAVPSTQPSQYYLVRADVFLGQLHTVMYALLLFDMSVQNVNGGNESGQNVKPTINVKTLWRSFGTY